MENNKPTTTLPSLRGKKPQEQREIITLTITSLEEEIKIDEDAIREKRKILNEWNIKLENIDSKLKNSERIKRINSLLEVCTPEEKEIIERAFKQE